MTNVEIKYNPFKSKTEIIVNGDEIAKTSNLYRYRNTPLEDWIDVLIPELVDYCNDDEILLSINSIQKYIDDVNDQIKWYSKKHRHVDIEVSEKASVGYKGRISKINQIRESVAESFEVDETAPDIQILIVSMSSVKEYQIMIEKMIGSDILDVNEGYLISNFQYEESGFATTQIKLPELDDSFINVEVLVFPCLEDCPNRYWRILKEKTAQTDNFILLAQLNDKPKNNDELYGYISEQMEKKGKQNRSRFIFMSNNTEENDEYLRDEYGVRNLTVLEDGEEDAALRLIKKYIQNVCYIRKIVDKEKKLREKLQSIQNVIEQEAEKNKSIEEISQIRIAYREQTNLLKRHYNSLSVAVCNPVNASLLKENFIEDLTIQIREIMVERVTNYLNGTNQTKIGNGPIDKVFSSHLMVDLPFKLASLSGMEPLEKIVKNCTAERLKAHVYEYIKRTFILKSSGTILECSVLLQTDYPIIALIEEIIDVDLVCNDFIQSISDINKKSESGLNMGFYKWVTENINMQDLGLYSYGFRYNTKIDCSAIETKVRRRLKTIEKEIYKFFAEITANISIKTISQNIEERIAHVEHIIENNVNEIMNKIEEYEKQLDISDRDKAEIANIEEIISDLNRTIEI